MHPEPANFNLFDYLLQTDNTNASVSSAAIEFKDQRISVDELRARTLDWAQRFRENGINARDRVALMLYDSPEFFACFLAAVSLGAICVPINTFLSGADVDFILNDSGARLVVVESDLLGKVTADVDVVFQIDSLTRVADVFKSAREIGAGIVDVSATTRESPAFLLYTSGSTGTPKGVLHRHGAIPVTVESYSSSVLALTPDDRIFSSSRLFFAYGLGNSLSFPLAASATVILEPDRVNADRLAELIETKKPTVFFGVPAVYMSLLDYRAAGGRMDLSSLRLCVSAGEALPASIYDEWETNFGLRILDGIGSTEMLHIFISNDSTHSRAGSSGRLVPGYQARMINDAGAQVPENETGNLWVRGESATAGYWNRPDLTEHAIQEGWVRTGDLYRKDEEGFFFHVGRSDDCFKVRGLWVSPIEVESVLVAHEMVSEAAVVSAIDENGLATALAYVVIRQGERSVALKDDISRFVSSRLPAFKVPSRIEFIDQMPRTATGKVQRFKLRSREQ